MGDFYIQKRFNHQRFSVSLKFIFQQIQIYLLTTIFAALPELPFTISTPAGNWLRLILATPSTILADATLAPLTAYTLTAEESISLLTSTMRHPFRVMVQNERTRSFLASIV